MHWSVAVKVARMFDDVTYKEWCDLYVNRLHPADDQIRIASNTAHKVLVRNKAIEPGVVIDRSPE